MARNIDGAMPLHTYKAKLLYLAMLGAAASANAQETPQSQSNVDDYDGQIEEVLVQGIRASIVESLSEKRNASAVVDAITAEDVGKFPDKNVADSLQRVPGVVIERDGGEGATVSIRGLSSDLTFTQLNGNFIASSEGEPSRSFSYNLLPSSMVERVEVFKSSEARLDEGGVGGTIILRSRKPLTMDANSGILNFEATYADTTEDFEPQYSGIYSWKNDVENLGFLLGYTRQERTNRTLRSEVEIWTRQNSAVYLESRTDGQVNDSGTRYYAPQNLRQEVTDEKRIREGLQLTGQWRINDNLELGGNYFRFSLTRDYTRNRIDFPEWVYSSNYITDTRQNERLGIITGIDFSVGVSGEQALSDSPWIRGEYNVEQSTSDTFDFYIDYQSDYFNAKLIAGHTEAEGGPTEKYQASYYNASDTEVAAQFWGWSFSGQALSSYIDPAILDNIKSGSGGSPDIGSTNSSFVNSEQEEDYLQLDLDFFVEWGPVKHVRTGYKYRDNKINRATSNTFWLSPDFDIAAAEAAGGVPRSASYQNQGGMPALANVIADNPLSNFPGGINTNIFPAIDWHKYSNYLRSNFVRYTRNEDNFVYNVNEEISALYLQAEYETNSLRGNFGLRYIDTAVTSDSSDLYVYNYDYLDQDSNILPEEQRYLEEFQVVSQKKNYFYLLPSLNVVWDLSEEWLMRGAISKTIARPAYGALGAVQNLVWNSQEYENDFRGRSDFDEDDTVGWHGRGGNKDLQPFESWQYDLSFEYYYGDGSGAGFALFRKEVDNFVVDLIIDAERNLPVKNITGNNGDTYVAGGDVTVQNYITTANGTDATSQGVELYIQHFFDNGFGVSSNYTYNKTNQAAVFVDGISYGSSPLVGSSDYQFNFSAFFENDDFSVRASYNRRGPTVGALNSFWNLEGDNQAYNFYTDDYSQVDVNASYSITDFLIATASVINLTKSETYVYLGDGSQSHFTSTEYSGRRFYVGLTYNF